MEYSDPLKNPYVQPTAAIKTPTRIICPRTLFPILGRSPPTTPNNGPNIRNVKKTASWKPLRPEDDQNVSAIRKPRVPPAAANVFSQTTLELTFDAMTIA